MRQAYNLLYTLLQSILERFTASIIRIDSTVPWWYCGYICQYGIRPHTTHSILTLYFAFESFLRSYSIKSRLTVLESLLDAFMQPTTIFLLSRADVMRLCLLLMPLVIWSECPHGGTLWEPDVLLKKHFWLSQQEQKRTGKARMFYKSTENRQKSWPSKK